MENKVIFFGLCFMLLQAMHASAEPETSLDNGSLTIYVDSGNEIDSFLSLAKKIEKTQSRIESALERMSEENIAMAKRILDEAKATEEKCNRRMAAEAKATEERLSAEITRLNQKLAELIKQLIKSSEVATPNKRPAERACEEIKKDLQTSGKTEFSDSPYYVLKLFTANSNISKICIGAFVDKRFVLTSGDCLHSQQFITVEIYPSAIDKKIKTIHIHINYSKSSTLHNIGLIELDSDVDYTHELYPVCLYVSQVNPAGDMTRGYIQVEIVADSDCDNMNTTNLQSSQICVSDLEDGESISGDFIFVEKKEFYKYELFGIVAEETGNRKPYVITKVFDHLDFIESIVWPNNEN